MAGGSAIAWVEQLDAGAGSVGGLVAHVTQQNPGILHRSGVVDSGTRQHL